MLDAQKSTEYGREPLELMRHVYGRSALGHYLNSRLHHDELWSAMSYGVSDRLYHIDLDDPQSDIFYPVTMDVQPQVGILSTVSFMNRYPTTDTNRNRHRAKIFTSIPQHQHFILADIQSTPTPVFTIQR